MSTDARTAADALVAAAQIPDEHRAKADRAPTILDLAAASGVSKATVSRVLNGSTRVAPETRLRVLAAIDALGFQVNRAARSLRTSRTGLIGVLVPIISVFGRIVEELDHDLASVGSSMLLTASRRRQPERDLDAIGVLVGRGVDALVLAPSHDSSPQLAALLRQVRTPIVLLDREVEGVMADAVHVDQGPGIRGAVEHLVAQGRRRVGLLSRDQKTRPGRQILAHYREQVARHRLPTDDRLVERFDDLDRQTARDGVDALLAAGADAIISTGTMEHTTTVLERLSALGVRVPRDVALVIYGYVGPTMGTDQTLPTVAYPVDAIARATFGALTDRSSDISGPPRVVRVPNLFLAPAPPVSRRSTRRSVRRSAVRR
jgi:LacI family transcriptional regulator